MVITVECPSCSTSFPVDSNKVPEGGVSVRCSSCSNVFRVERPEEAGETNAWEPLAFETEGDEAPAADEGEAALPDEWVVEVQDTPAPPEAADEPAGIAEETTMFVADDLPAEPEPEATPEPEPEVQAVEPEPAPEPEPVLEPEVPTAPEPAPEPPAAEPEPEPAPAAEAPAAGSAPIQGFTFGKRDPAEKARRLARVLVSDMIMYNPERHEKALAAGTLKDDFEDEIEKSWKEYVEQVGEEMAEGQGKGFWADALNDVLAKGQQLF